MDYTLEIILIEKKNVKAKGILTMGPLTIHGILLLEATENKEPYLLWPSRSYHTVAGDKFTKIVVVSKEFSEEIRKAFISELEALTQHPVTNIPTPSDDDLPF